MNVKEAVATAKGFVAELFAPENISDLGLEEVSLDDQSGQWLVTLGFARPWDRTATGFAAVVQAGVGPPRSYKVVRISNLTKEIISLTNRD